MLNKRVYVASQEGAKLRLLMNDDDNKLRGYAYRLTNALSSGNRDMYMDTVMRMYNGLRAKDGKRLPVPDILLQMFDDDQFSEIGYSYLFGVKGNYEDKEKKENGGEEINK